MSVTGTLMGQSVSATKLIMNVFRLVGDLTHLISFFVLLWRLYKHKSAAGISLKTQELFLIVFCTRYLDLFTNFYSLYNSFMKVAYISLAAMIVYMIRYKEPYRSTNDKSQDSFLHLQFGVLPCAILALIINMDFTFSEIIWTFSIYLEAIAIVPQLIVLQRFREVENLTSNYIVMLGMYRGMYILNWIYRAQTEEYYHGQWIVWISGVIQTALYIDFFYYYVQSKYHGGAMKLPS